MTWTPDMEYAKAEYGMNNHYFQQQHSFMKPPSPSSTTLVKRRRDHNTVEKRRRNLINATILELAGLLPEERRRGVKLNKGSILRLVATYIKDLQQEKGLSAPEAVKLPNVDRRIRVEMDDEEEDEVKTEDVEMQAGKWERVPGRRNEVAHDLGLYDGSRQVAHMYAERRQPPRLPSISQVLPPSATSPQSRDSRDSSPQWPPIYTPEWANTTQYRCGIGPS